MVFVGGREARAVQKRLSAPSSPPATHPCLLEPHSREDTASPGFYKTSLFTF